MYQRILVPLDGSKLAEQAIPYAAELCKGATEVTLFQVVHLPLPLVAPDASMAVPMPDPKQLLQDALDYLNGIAEKLREEGVRVVTDAVERDAVAEALVEYAQEHDIDLIVMTTHGRSGLSRLIFGSVAESVVRHAPCPVLLVRAELVEEHVEKSGS
ncbi:MAG TPA: universal stress protein [Caldilineales bacterium]|nr:universal stress protein [Caldilineales bacterium]